MGFILQNTCNLLKLYCCSSFILVPIMHVQEPKHSTLILCGLIHCHEQELTIREQEGIGIDFAKNNRIF